jgi:peptidyl-prolyl cis-trans isomerase B (cyclophilin B)
MKQITPNLPAGKGARVSFAWEGLTGVSTFVELAPDLRKVPVEALDLAETRVKLITEQGDMVLKFHPDKAPNTVANFVKLAKDGFYDATRFHRVMAGFMIQGGCPNSKPGAVGRPGTGNPGYRVKAEFNDLKHVKGVLSMARNEGDNDSAGCQFFIMHATKPFLDGQYTAFGELQSGVDTLDKIANAQVNGETPVEPVSIRAAIVLPAFKKKD